MGSLNSSKKRAIQSPLLAFQLRALLTQPDFRTLSGSNLFSIKEMTKALESNPILALALTSCPDTSGLTLIFDPIGMSAEAGSNQSR